MDSALLFGYWAVTIELIKKDSENFRVLYYRLKMRE